MGGLDEYIVYVMNGLHVDRKKVTVGARSGYHIEIKSGLKEGDQVVTRGNYQLQYVSVGRSHSHEHEHNHDKHSDEITELNSVDELIALDALLEEPHEDDNEQDEHAEHNH